MTTYYKSISIKSQRRESDGTDFTLPPFASAQKRPNAVVVPDLDLEVLEILAHRRLNLLLLDKQNGAIQANVHVRDKYRVERDVISAKI
jgi:hypothetical protein